MKLVLTGGPSGGKTALASAIEKQFCGQVAIVPESASLLFRGGFPRLPGRDTMRYQQRAIFFVQHELEDLIAGENPGKLLVCDRGTLDGLAYWPMSQESFFKDLKTSMKKEMSRYHLVLHLETAEADHYDQTNPVGREGHAAAALIDRRIKAIWAKHPNHVVIPAGHDFSHKIAMAVGIVSEVIKELERRRRPKGGARKKPRKRR
jgi:nicotinamide riboside kinase